MSPKRVGGIACLFIFTLAGCASHKSTSTLMGDSDQRIELTGFRFDTDEQGDTRTATFGGHRAVFEPMRIVIDDEEVFAGPYRRAAVSRGPGASVQLTVDGKRVPVARRSPPV